MKQLSIKEVCEKYEISEVYLRRQIQRGIIPTTKVEIAKNTFKHLINEEDIITWRRNKANRSVRSDNRSKFILYATKEELAVIEELLKENEVESIIQRANKVKETI